MVPKMPPEVTTLSPTLSAPGTPAPSAAASHRQQDHEIEDAKDEGEGEQLHPDARRTLRGRRHGDNARSQPATTYNCERGNGHESSDGAEAERSKLLPECFEGPKRYSVPDPPHGVKVKGQIMQRVKGTRGHLAGHVQVPQIGPRMAAAGVAAARRIERPSSSA